MNISKKGFLDILTLAMLWGPSFLFIKIATDDITPITLVALRIGFGALFLYGILKFKKIQLPNNPILWGHCLVLGLFANSLPFMCFNFSILSIPTSLSALINGMTPVLTILLANLCLSDERLTWNRGIGILIGFSGFLVLFLPAVLGITVGLEITGMIFSFLGACSYAVGMVYARKYLRCAPPLVAPMMQLATSVCYLFPMAFIFETPIPLIQEASLSAWAGVLGLAFLGTTLAFILYYRIIVRQGAIALAMVAYLLPLIGTALGVIFLKEQIGIHFAIAAILILCGVMVVNGAIHFPRLAIKKGMV